jgi:hypothetical protein
MNQDESASDPLLGAICEFRQELIQWIDRQLAYSRDRERRLEPGPSAPVVASLVRGSLIETQMTPTAASGSANPRTVDSAEPQDFVPSRPAAPKLGSNREPEAMRQVGEHPTEPFTAADARNRLDALARQLGERLRASEEARKGN